jgi:predicted permease
MGDRPKQTPPSFPFRLFQWFCRPEYHLDIEGDLLELFDSRRKERGYRYAHLLLYIDILMLFRPSMIRPLQFRFLQNQPDMFKLNFILSWRHLLKNSIFSIVNVGGLMLGMAVALLIGLWIRHEMSYDTFQKNYDDIYQVIANRDFNGNIFTDRNMTFPFARVIGEEIPEVKNAVWTSHSQSELFTRGENSIKHNGYFVGGPYFDMFSWEFVQGDPATALKDPNSMVITESMAEKYFGGEDAMLQSLTLNNDRELTITGIVKDPPDNSSRDFDYLRPFDFSSDNIKRLLDHWQNYSWEVYIQPQPGADMVQLEKDLTKIMVERTGTEESTYFAFPMEKWHLHNEFNNGLNTGGTIRYVRLFGIIAVIILLIACINFMNLSTARSQKRAMEVAVRKTLGSGKATLIQQFLTESTLIALMAFVGAMLIVALSLPAFNRLVDKTLTMDLWNPVWWLAGLALVMLSGLVSGSYPAFMLSSFKPIMVMRGESEGKNSAINPRRFLVVFQFVASIALISATILVFQQIQYVKNRDIGYDPDNLLMIPSTGAINENYVAIKDQLMQTGQVAAVTKTSSPITQIWSKSPAPDWPGKPPETAILFSNLHVHGDYTSTMDIKILEGRDFTGTLADTSSVIINEAAVKAMKLENPIGQQLNYGGDQLTIIGVVEDVVMESPFAPVEPQMIHFAINWSSYVNIRLAEGVQPQAVMPTLESTFKQFNPGYPFEYEFVDEAFGEKFAHEQLVLKVTNIFAGMAIFISCLGLIGLVAYIIEKRMKEIAIRKVLGATQSSLLLLIGKEFLILVIVSLIIATPITYYGVHNWLENYEYQVGINWWVFLLVGAMLLLLTLLIVGVQTVRAALANPINAIRLER